jgi:peptidoglycan/LPS O-acetylase OafA/YrhL
MTGHHWFIFAAAALAVWAYADRLNDMTWWTHLTRCVAAQSLGALCCCLLMYSAAGGVSPGLLYPALLVVLLHLSVTSERWQSGPPPETESRPMPLDGAPQ